MTHQYRKSIYIVATPIGNLADITFRAVETLKECDVVLSEDTRVTKKLLNHFKIDTNLERFDAKAEQEKTDDIIERVNQGEKFALVSDAGTPGISDPGAHLVNMAQASGINVVPIPGASALVTALSASGVKSDNFVFLGFPPHKKGRKTFFENLAHEERTAVFYESPHRFIKALESLHAELPEEREIVVARELTKIHEEFVRGSAEEVLDNYKKDPDSIRGEFVVIVSGK